METTLLITLLIFILLISVAQIILFANVFNSYKKSIQVMTLTVEAIGKLTQAQKSSLSYLQKIQKELDSNDGK